jgi:hypothetical protein
MFNNNVQYRLIVYILCLVDDKQDKIKYKSLFYPYIF